MIQGQIIFGTICLFILLIHHTSIVAFSDDIKFGLITAFDILDLLTILLYSTFFGTFPAAMMTFFAFVLHSFFVREFAFTDFNMLIAALVAGIPVRFRWYKKWSKTLFAPILFTFVLLFSSILIFGLLDEKSQMETYILLARCWLLGCFCISAITAIFARIYFSHASEEKKTLTLSGLYFSEQFGQLEQNRVRKVNISAKLMILLWLEAAILIVLAVIFVRVMNPDMNPLSQFLKIAVSAHHRPSYYAKLVLLLLNATIPLVLIANVYAQSKIAIPVQLMTAAMSDFTNDVVEDEKQSVLDIHLLKIKTGDEIEDLHKTLCATADKLSCYIEKIKNEKRLEEDLRIALGANKAKSAFLSNMSHEIRTPINAVLGLDEMILRESREEQTRLYAADIKSAGKSLLAIVNDVLDFSKIEAGKMEILPVEYDLSSAINDLVNMISKRAKDKNLDFRVEVNPKTPHILRGDDVRIKQCVLNILTNAVKYTKEGSVTLFVDFQKKDAGEIDLSFRVVDTGIGIKTEDLPKLYSAFERIEEEKNRTIEGTGLGMNIVKRLLSMMGSELHVQSEYGKGSDFSFSVKQHVENWEPIGDFSKTYKKSIDANETYTERFHASASRILVVDDTKLNLTVVCGLLKRTEIQIDTAESGLAAISLVREKKYDAIFIDHRMPNMDGIETLKAMNQIEDWINAGVPCIALTANAISGARERYLDEGFTDYLSKPVDGFKLESMLLKYLPSEKITLTQKSENANESTDFEKSEIEEFEKIQGIDAKTALKNCWSADVLRDALKDFVCAIDEKSKKIEEFAESGDWKNYTILVHALKSSARLIGATELSDFARELEKKGDEADAHTIREKTPALLSLYKTYKEHLASFSKNEKAEKPLIQKDELLNAYDALRESTLAFDFSTVDKIIEEIDSYSLPKDEVEKFERIKKQTQAIDQAGILAALDGENFV